MTTVDITYVLKLAVKRLSNIIIIIIIVVVVIIIIIIIIIACVIY